MLRPKPLYIALLFMGLAGGVLRAMELDVAYDVATGLAEPGHPLTLALAALTLLAGALSLTLALTGTPDTEGRGFQGARVPMVIAALALAGGSIADILDMMENSVTLTQMALAILGLFTSVTLLVMVNTVAARKTHGMFATIAVFWASFWLLLLFAGNAGNPVLGQFVYEFLGSLCSVMAFFFFAGCHFGREHPKWQAFTLGMGIYLVFVSLVGPAVAWLFFPQDALLDGVTLSGLLRLLFSAVYLLCIPTLTRRVARMPDDEEPDDEEPADDEDDDDYDTDDYDDDNEE